MKKIMMKKRTEKRIVKIFILAVFVAMNVFPASRINAARLTTISDTMSTNKTSGTGSATAGYTQSAAEVTEGFVIVTGSNNIICFDIDETPSFDVTCTGTGNVKTNLVTNGGLTSGSVYTGDQVALAIATALEATDSDADDSYTVSYDESTDLFTIRGDGANTLNTDIGWDTYAGTDNADTTLGFTTDDSDLRSANQTSNTAVAFNVVLSSNDTFTVQIDGTTSGTITIAAGSYTAASLVTQMDTKIDADGTLGTKNVTVSYSSDKFVITSDTTGGGSKVRATEGATDFLKTVSLNGDFPVDGEVSDSLVSANHTITFTTTTAVAAGEKIVITFPAGFTLPVNLNYEDMDLNINSGEITLAATPSGATWGASFSGQVVTFESGTGTIGAGQVVIIEIGRNATTGVVGDEQIGNPTTTGLYQTEVKTTTSGDVTIDDAYAASYLISDSSVVVTATVDPILSFALYGGSNIDFGTLEPNAYHKLGGAQNAYGSVDLAAITPSGTHDTQTVTVKGVVYEFSDDGAIATTSQSKVNIVDNSGSYLTAVQVAANLARAINNYDGDLVRANIDPTDTDKVWIMAITPGTAGNSYSLATTVTGASVSAAALANGVSGYNTKGDLVTYTAGSSVGNGSTGSNLVVSTNGAGGYVLTVENTDTNGVTDAADGFTNGSTEIEEWTTGNFGYGILASSQSARYGDATSAIIEAAFQGDGTGDLPEAMSTAPLTLAQFTTGDINPATTAGDNIAIEYNVRIDAAQAAGAYADTITYIFTATF